MSTLISRLTYRRPIITDLQTTHRTVMHMTVGERILWCSPTRRLLIIQHEGPLTVQDRAQLDAATTGVRQTRFPVGTRVALTLIGSPTMGRSGVDAHGVRRKRHLVPLDQQAAWFTRHLDGAVHVSQVEVQPLGPSHGDHGDGTTVTITRSGFAATGTVTNTDRLEHLIVRGIGDGKAYGCGLLLVTEEAA